MARYLECGVASDTVGVEVFRFNNWANETLIEYCGQLDDTQLQATLPGTRGSLMDTLVHIVAAQERYADGLGRPRRTGRVHESLGWPGIEDLRASCRESGTALLAAAAEEDPAREFRRLYQEREVVIRADTVLIQAIHHGNDHRTQICSILGSLGLEPPEITGWGYAEGRKTAHETAG